MKPLFARCCAGFWTWQLLGPGLVLQAATDATDLGGPKLAPAYGELQPSFWDQHSTALLIFGGLFVAVLLFAIWKKLHPAAPPVLPPEVQAREALSELSRQPEEGPQLSRVSRVVRLYFSAAFGLPTGELTTAEFSGAVASHEKTGEELAQLLSGLLRECDERKFSPVRGAPPLNAADRALELVNRAEERRALIRAQAMDQAPRPR